MLTAVFSAFLGVLGVLLLCRGVGGWVGGWVGGGGSNDMVDRKLLYKEQKML